MLKSKVCLSESDATVVEALGWKYYPHLGGNLYVVSDFEKPPPLQFKLRSLHLRKEITYCTIHWAITTLQFDKLHLDWDEPTEEQLEAVRSALEISPVQALRIWTYDFGSYSELVRLSAANISDLECDVIVWRYESLEESIPSVEHCTWRALDIRVYPDSEWDTAIEDVISLAARMPMLERLRVCAPQRPIDMIRIPSMPALKVLHLSSEERPLDLVALEMSGMPMLEKLEVWGMHVSSMIWVE